jgi:hypothetical protein
MRPGSVLTAEITSSPAASCMSAVRSVTLATPWRPPPRHRTAHSNRQRGRADRRRGAGRERAGTSTAEPFVGGAQQQQDSTTRRRTETSSADSHGSGSPTP